MVLVMLVVVSTLTGAVMLVYLARHRLVTRDLQRVQAVYAAEAAVFAALARFDADPTWRAIREPIAIPWSETRGAQATTAESQGTSGQRGSASVEDHSPVVSARALGAYLQVRADAGGGRAHATIHTLAGQETFDPFDYAVVLGDTTTALSLAGATRITGDLLTGPRGARTARLRRRPFTGSVDGQLERIDEVPLPELDGDLVAETVERFDGYLDALPDSLARFPEVWEDADAWGLAEERLFVDSLRILRVGDGGTLTAADSTLLDRPVFLVAAGDLTIAGSRVGPDPGTPRGFRPRGATDGVVRLAAGSTVLVSGTLRVAGAFQADDVILFADRVDIDGAAEFSGQVIARRSIEVDGGAYLRYPSVLYTAATDVVGSRDDRIEIGQAVVDGTIVYPPYRGGPSSGGGAPRGEPVRIVIGEDATVRGSVYNGRKTQVAGRVVGTLLTQQTYLYASPASYVNWLSDAVLDRETRDDPYLVPMLFPGRSQPAVVRWTETSTISPRTGPVASDGSATPNSPTSSSP